MCPGRIAAGVLPGVCYSAADAAGPARVVMAVVACRCRPGNRAWPRAGTRRHRGLTNASACRPNRAIDGALLAPNPAKSSNGRTGASCRNAPASPPTPPRGTLKILPCPARYANDRQRRRAGDPSVSSIPRAKSIGLPVDFLSPAPIEQGSAEDVPRARTAPRAFARHPSDQPAAVAPPQPARPSMSQPTPRSIRTDPIAERRSRP